MKFSTRNTEPKVAAIRALKQSATGLLEAGDDDVVIVNELQCLEPGCPPVETVVALFRKGCEPKQWSIHKSAMDVTEDDLRNTIASSRFV